jgi:hypothetical protein
MLTAPLTVLKTTDGHLMLKTVKGTVNKQMYTTGGYLMIKTVRGAVKI